MSCARSELALKKRIGINCAVEPVVVQISPASPNGVEFVADPTDVVGEQAW